MQQTVARDIRDEITSRDLEAVRTVLQAHLFAPIPEGIELQSATELNGMRTLLVGLELADHRFDENASYVIELTSESNGEPWKLDQITIQREQTVPGQDDPISVVGALELDTVAELVEHVSRFWTKAGAGQMKISAVSSNILPPLRLQPAALQGNIPEAVYVVHVNGLEPIEPHRHSGTGSAGLVISSSSSDSVFNVWLKRGERNRLVTTDVYAAGLPASDPDRLELLGSHLEQPSDPGEEQQRMDAAMAVIPETANRTNIQGLFQMLVGQTELLMANVPELQVGDRRKETGMVSCGRVAGTDTPWNCSYHATSATQTVPGQQTEIILRTDGRTDADEALINEIADALRAALAVHSSMKDSVGDIEIRIMSSTAEKWEAQFLRGLQFYSVSFRYDGELDILAVESKN